MIKMREMREMANVRMRNDKREELEIKRNEKCKQRVEIRNVRNKKCEK